MREKIKTESNRGGSSLGEYLVRAGNATLHYIADLIPHHHASTNISSARPYNMDIPLRRCPFMYVVAKEYV